jgi:hypothetical protein
MNSGLVHRLHVAFRELGSGQWLVGAIVISLAWILHSMAIVFGPSRGVDPVDASEEDRRHDAAVAWLRSRRRALIWSVLVLAVVPVVLLVAYIRDHDPGGVHWVRWTLLGTILILLVLGAVQLCRKPLNAAQVQRTMDRLGRMEAPIPRPLRVFRLLKPGGSSRAED